MFIMVVSSKAFAANSILEDLKADKDTPTLDPNDDPDNIPEGTAPDEKEENDSKEDEKSALSQSGELKNEEKPTTNPYTGIEDYPLYIFIGIFGVSAIYAYKKVRDYNA